MLIKIGFEIAFVFPEPTAMMLMLYLHPTRLPTVRMPEHLRVDPWVMVPDFFDANGNRCGRALVPAGRVVFRNHAVVHDCGLPDLQVPECPAGQHPGSAAGVLHFLACQPLLRGRQRVERACLAIIRYHASRLAARVKPFRTSSTTISALTTSRRGRHARRWTSIANGWESAATTCIWQLRFAAA